MSDSNGNNSFMRKAIDLFAGCGGLSEGLRHAAFHVIHAVEILETARSTYKLNHSSTTVDTDIRMVNADDILHKHALLPGELDLLAACPPCQGFSAIRTKNQKAADDERNDLIFEVSRLASTLLPKAILIENVPQIIQDYRFDKFVSILKEKGYAVNYGVLDAQNFSVPQRRKRMILIACRLGNIPIPQDSRRKITVREAIGKLPPSDSDHHIRLHNMRQQLSAIVQQRINLIKKNRCELPRELVLKCHIKYSSGFKDVYGRMSWDDVSPTITRSSHNPSKGRFIHPSENRGLTLFEALLLQGFPPHFRFPENIGIGKIASMIGEAVPPPMAQAQAEHIHKYLDLFEQAKANG